MALSEAGLPARATNLTGAAVDDRAMVVLRQEEQIARLETNGDDGWTIIYQSHEFEDRDETCFAALLSAEAAVKAISAAGFDAHLGSGGPSICMTFEDGRSVVSYERVGYDGVEPLVVLQNHHHLRPAMLPQLAEEFRLFHNLWVSPDGTQLIKIDDDGNETVAAEVSDTQVRVRTSLLRRYQAARQMTLATYVDSRAWVEGTLTKSDIDELRTERSDASIAYHRSAGTGMGLGNRSFSIVNGKRLVPPPPSNMSGQWPFEPPQRYPEFIIGEDEFGQPERNTCDPDALSNYFGKNPGAPHFLTPVFFDRSVLQRYYEQPEKFEVRDGYLTCGQLWGIAIDNDHPDIVMVFLGDLGTMPESERGHWMTHNIVPTSPPSATAVGRAFLGQFVSPKAPDLRFQHEYTSFCRKWADKFGWNLFREPNPKDAHVLQRVRVPVNTSQPEFEQQLLNITKLQIDWLNDAKLRELTADLDAGAKSIAKLEAWMTMSGYPHVARDTDFLRRLQRLRSRITAHRKGSDYEGFLLKEGVDPDPRREISSILEGAIQMLTDLAIHFELAVDGALDGRAIV